MIRFKVVRASRLLLVAAIVLLACVLALLGTRLWPRKEVAPVGGANLVEEMNDDEAKTAVVFASNNAGAMDRSMFEPESIEIDIVKEAPQAEQQPSILIYHTHTHEAYEQVAEDPYDALEAWRTADVDHSIVRVGEELADALRRYGFEVVHDTTDHEADQLSTAYTRSLETLRGYEQRFDLYIDLHRDAYVEGEPLAFTSESGEQFASLMMLIGNGNGFDEKPFYRQNHAFASALEERINAIMPGLCKPVLVKDGRYNQHIGVFSILVEVGHNRNTLRQALGSVSPLAEALYSLMLENPDPVLVGMQAEWKQNTDY